MPNTESAKKRVRQTAKRQALNNWRKRRIKAQTKSFLSAITERDVNTAEAMCEYGSQQVKYCLKASQNLGLKAMPTFSGALMWHTVYPWPQRPAGLVDVGFEELARRWRPLLDKIACTSTLHRNTAARRKSRLAQRLNALKKSKA